MDKYRRAFDTIQTIYDACTLSGDYKGMHYAAAVHRLGGLVHVACCDMDLTAEEYKEIESWKIKRREEE